MSEMVGSAIVGEAVNRVFSGVISNHVDKPDERGNTERLEMAHIKIEAAVEISRKWYITDMSLLRWQRKLKRASQECSDTMRECKRRSQENQRFQEQIKQSSFPRCVAHATKSFMSSLIGLKNDEFPSNATVQRFERLADGANDFLRYIELGGTPRKYLFFDSLSKHVFAGKYVQYEIWNHSRYHCFGILPVSSEGCGLGAKVGFSCEDQELPENSFQSGCMLRLSESIDIIGTIIKCLQLVTPHFKSTTEVMIKELIQLPTQDFCWLPCNSYDLEQWNHVHYTLTRCVRPDPFCCQGHVPIMPSDCTCRSRNASIPSAIFPEPVIQVYLQRGIPLSDYNSVQRPITKLTLKLGVLFAPHDHFKSADGIESSVTETIDGEKQQGAPFDAHPHQLDEKLLPKAINFLSRNAAATTYQISWKSSHGSAHLCVDKINVQTIIKHRATPQGVKKCNLFLECQDRLNKRQWKQVARDFLKIWGYPVDHWVGNRSLYSQRD